MYSFTMLVIKQPRFLYDLSPWLSNWLVKRDHSPLTGAFFTCMLTYGD